MSKDKEENNLLIGCGDKTKTAIDFLYDKYNCSYLSTAPGGTYDLGAQLYVDLKHGTNLTTIVHLQHAKCGLGGALVKHSKGEFLDAYYPHRSEVLEHLERKDNQDVMEDEVLGYMHRNFMIALKKQSEKIPGLQNVQVVRCIYDRHANKIREYEAVSLSQYKDDNDRNFNDIDLGESKLPASSVDATEAKQENSQTRSRL